MSLKVHKLKLHTFYASDFSNLVKHCFVLFKFKVSFERIFKISKQKKD